MRKFNKNFLFLLIIIALSIVLVACNTTYSNNTQDTSENINSDTQSTNVAKNKEDFIWFSNAIIGINNDDIEEIIIPDSCEEIVDGAFRHCYKLKKLTTPVFSFDSYNALLTSYFSQGPYIVCPTLEKVTITKGNIPSNFFGNVSNNSFLITEIVINNGIQRIESEAFSGCSQLKDLYLPNSIQYIGANIVGASKNTNIHYNGTKTEWKNITKDNDWRGSYVHLTIICVDGIVCL